MLEMCLPIQKFEKLIEKLISLLFRETGPKDPGPSLSDDTFENN